MHDLAPWTNFVRGWAPSHKFIRQLKEWYPYIAEKTFDNSEGYIIGHNHTFHKSGPSKVTPAQAHELLIGDLIAVQSCMEETIKIEISEGQYQAIMSWIFDLGRSEWVAQQFPRLLLMNDQKLCIGQMASYRTKNHCTDLERSLRRAQEVSWWNEV